MVPVFLLPGLRRRRRSPRGHRASRFRPPRSVWSSHAPLGRQVLEGGGAVLPGQILVELVLQRVQTVAVAGAGAKLGDVEAGSVRHVDHEGVGKDHEVELLQDTNGEPESKLRILPARF